MFPNENNYLLLNSVKKSFIQNDRVDVLDNISFEVEKHSLTSIFGPNGSGKTTILNLISGILKPDEGTIKIDGGSISEANMSFIFQDYNSSLMPWFTCLDNVAFPLKLRSVKKSERRTRAKEFIISKLDLNIPLDKFPYQLSGGQKQMTAIARALILNPDLLLMDEAFGSLDYTVKLNLEEKLLEIWEKIRNTILMISHDVDDAVFLSDKIIIISKRPSKVIGVIKVDLPRPRKLDIIGSEKFQEIRRIVITKFLDAQK